MTTRLLWTDFERWVEAVISVDTMAPEARQGWLAQQRLAGDWDALCAHWSDRMRRQPELDARYRALRGRRSASVAPLEPLAALAGTALAEPMAKRPATPFEGKAPRPAPQSARRSLEPIGAFGQTAPLSPAEPVAPLPSGFSARRAAPASSAGAAPRPPASEPRATAATSAASPAEREPPPHDTVVVCWPPRGESPSLLASRTWEVLHALRQGGWVTTNWLASSGAACEPGAVLLARDEVSVGGVACAASTGRWTARVGRAQADFAVRFVEGEAFASSWRPHRVTLALVGVSEVRDALLEAALVALVEVFEPRWGYAGVALDEPADGTPPVGWWTYVDRGLGAPRGLRGALTVDRARGHLVRAYPPDLRGEGSRRDRQAAVRRALAASLRPYSQVEALMQLA